MAPRKQCSQLPLRLLPPGQLCAADLRSGETALPYDAVCLRSTSTTLPWPPQLGMRRRVTCLSHQLTCGIVSATPDLLSACTIPLTPMVPACPPACAVPKLAQLHRTKGKICVVCIPFSSPVTSHTIWGHVFSPQHLHYTRFTSK